MILPYISGSSRRLFANITIAVAAAGLLAGPSRATEKTDPAIQATAGSEFTISLDSNRTTGFSWQLAKPLDEAMVKSVRNDYQNPRQTSGKEPVMGAPGRELWTFKALKPGKTTIEFKYVRPWEKDKAPEKTKIIEVVVKSMK